MQRLPYIVLVAGSLIAVGWVIMATQSNVPNVDAQNPYPPAEEMDKKVAGIPEDVPKPAATTEELWAQYKARVEGRD